jgi:MerR family transcriptional regulator, redox-sensitive transcriptional activator SoxR
MHIGELARQAGLRTSAIRYYEEIGILAPAGRISGRREYGPEALNTLSLVQAAQKAGFTLEEIRALMSTITNGQRSSKAWPALAHAKLDELDDSIKRLKAARAALVDALDCACAGKADACKLVTRMRSSDAARPRRASAAPARRSRT